MAIQLVARCANCERITRDTRVPSGSGPLKPIEQPVIVMPNGPITVAFSGSSEAKTFHRYSVHNLYYGDKQCPSSRAFVPVDTPVRMVADL